MTRVHTIAVLAGAAHRYTLAGDAHEAARAKQAQADVAELVLASRAACRAGTLAESDRLRLNLAIRRVGGKP